jgi:amino acid transporter
MNNNMNLDAEKAFDPNLKHEVDVPSGSDDGVGAYEEQPPFWTRMGLSADSFRQRHSTDKHNSLNKTMKTRHLHMIAIGGSIGAGLFVGSGSALRRGGPAALIIGFLIIGIVSDISVLTRQSRLPANKMSAR